MSRDPAAPRSTAASLQARAAAYTRWAFEEDRTAATRPAREAFERRFEREVDPEGRLPARERARRAEAQRTAYSYVWPPPPPGHVHSAPHGADERVGTPGMPWTDRSG